jgi:hypothetical protein
VLVLDIKKPRFLYCRVGDSLWSVHEYDIGDEKLPPEYAPPRKLVSQQTAAVDGKFYFGETGKLGSSISRRQRRSSATSTARAPSSRTDATASTSNWWSHAGNCSASASVSRDSHPRS